MHGRGKLKQRVGAAAGAAAMVSALVAAVPLGARAPQVQAPTTNVQVTKGASLLTVADTPSLVRDPAHPADLVLVDRIDRPDYSASVQYSTDNGASWHASALQPPPESDFQGALALVPHKLYGPDAAFDAKGNLYVLFVTLSGPGNQPDGVWIERSTDGGESFRPPTAVAGPHAFQVSLAIDAHTGRLFATWLQTQAFLCVLCFPTTGMPIVLSQSADGGATWSTPVRVSDPGLARVGSPVVAVGPHGNPSVVYFNYETDQLDWGNLPGTYHGNFSLMLAASKDGGASFAPGQVVDSSVVPPYRFIVYLAPEPGFAIGSDGERVVTWSDGRSGNPQVLARYSSGAGATWGGPVVVNGDTAQGSAQILPAVSVAPDGQVDILYYDSTGSTANVYLSSSSDGGATFPTVTQVSTASSNLQVGPQGSPFFTSQADFGSRLSLVSTNHHVLAAWTDSRNGTVNTGKQDIYFASIAVTPPASFSGILVIVVVAFAVLAVAGLILLIIGRRRSGRSGGRPGSARPDAADLPPPPPPLIPSPGQV
ncbi:MAG: sialidase family protein [Acidimicrobiales bacterium]